MSNYKGLLQELCAKRNSELPTYELISKVGPDHAPTFTVIARAMGLEASEAAYSKSQAERLAASTLYDKLKHLETYDERKSISVMSILMTFFACTLNNRAMQYNYCNDEPDVVFNVNSEDEHGCNLIGSTIDKLQSVGIKDHSACNRLKVLLNSVAEDNDYECIFRERCDGILFRNKNCDNYIASSEFKSTSTLVSFDNLNSAGDFTVNVHNNSSVKVNFKLDEVIGDLFTVSDDYSLMHCVAEDLKMSAGIAVTFKSRFNRISELAEQQKSVGDVAVLQDSNRFIYYLVTKQFSHDKPTYETLKSSLMSMKRHCIENNVRKVAAPKIGCGLDLLKWNRVKNLIHTVFSDTEIEIIVYDNKIVNNETQVKDIPLVPNLELRMTNECCVRKNSEFNKHSKFALALKEYIVNCKSTHNGRVTIIVSKNNPLKDIPVDDLLTLVRSTVLGTDIQVRISYD